MNFNPYITGWAHTRFGKLEASAEDLLREVVTNALKDAQLEPQDIDAVYLGTFNGGFLPQDFSASLIGLVEPALRFTPATRVENACATGSAAVYQGIQAIRAGARAVLVVGMEKMNTLPTADVGNVLLKCSYVAEEGHTPGGFAGVFGQIAANYFERFGDQSDALAHISAKNHSNGMCNPYAHMQKDLGFDFCRHPSEKNPMVAGPLKRSDCSLVSDGAAAMVLVNQALSQNGRRAVGFRASVQVNDFLPLSKRDPSEFAGARLAWQRALEQACVDLSSLSLVETHDCFTIAELIEYEAMGLVPRGQGARAILEGWTRKDGKLPINPSGGLKSRGHPIGATGVSQHVMAAMQATGEAGDMQIKNAGLVGVFNMGGAAVTNYVSILERTR
jgi:acetyl-CoA C-acetyltransferase